MEQYKIIDAEDNKCYAEGWDGSQFAQSLQRAKDISLEKRGDVKLVGYDAHYMIRWVCPLK